MSGPFTIRWGIMGGPEWPEERNEEHLDDALAVAAANGGTIFDARGHQLTAEDIAAHHQHPYRRAAELIVDGLLHGLGGRKGIGLEIHGEHGCRVGYWTMQSAVVIVERNLEGSGL